MCISWKFHLIWFNVTEKGLVLRRTVWSFGYGSFATRLRKTYSWSKILNAKVSQCNYMGVVLLGKWLRKSSNLYNTIFKDCQKAQSMDTIKAPSLFSAKTPRQYTGQTPSMYSGKTPSLYSGSTDSMRSELLSRSGLSSDSLSGQQYNDYVLIFDKVRCDVIFHVC